MANPGSYTITLSNNRAEGEAFSYLAGEHPYFRLLSSVERKYVMERMGLAHSFRRAFDLVLLPSKAKNALEKTDPKDWILIELKTTKKKLVKRPAGFFFGATENEFKLAVQLGDRYKFCFVSLHPESMGYTLLTYPEMLKLVRTQRTQYQINL